MKRYSKFIYTLSLFFGLALGLCLVETSHARMPRNYIVVLDTSGSMTMSELLPSVYVSLGSVLKSIQPKDRLILHTFDLKSKGLIDFEYQNPADLEKFMSEVKKVKALGQWTNLIGALEHSIKKSIQLLKLDPERENLILLYTDGVHHLPPWILDGDREDFDDLYLRYYQDGEFDSRKKDNWLPWFVYYVELDVGDTHLKRFLNQTESGVLISKKEFNPRKSFLKEVPKEKPKQIKNKSEDDSSLRVYGSIALLVVFLILFFSRYKIVRRG